MSRIFIPNSLKSSKGLVTHSTCRNTLNGNFIRHSYRAFKSLVTRFTTYNIMSLCLLGAYSLLGVPGTSSNSSVVGTPNTDAILLSVVSLTS
jgi:hypothetical protein